MSNHIKFSFLNSDEEERYQKHLTLKEIGYEGQLDLKNSSVLCIGAGGLGSSVLLYLAAAGIGRIGIVCLLYTSPSPRDLSTSRMPSSA